jgi:transposase, IS30 family
MARHQQLSAATGIDIYFADRSSPWQRGANENFNGLARQYFPKGTDLSIHTAKHVKAVTRELNTRPRKSLGYHTPETRFQAEIRRLPDTPPRPPCPHRHSPTPYALNHQAKHTSRCVDS